jgi:hypothetical protein
VPNPSNTRLPILESFICTALARKLPLVVLVKVAEFDFTEKEGSKVITLL